MSLLDGTLLQQWIHAYLSTMPNFPNLSTVKKAFNPRWGPIVRWASTVTRGKTSRVMQFIRPLNHQNVQPFTRFRIWNERTLVISSQGRLQIRSCSPNSISPRLTTPSTNRIIKCKDFRASTGASPWHPTMFRFLSLTSLINQHAVKASGLRLMKSTTNLTLRARSAHDQRCSRSSKISEQPMTPTH